jgi:hypothetical protein
MLAYLIQPSLPLFRIAIIGEFTWIMSDYEECVDFTWWVFADKLVVYSYYQDFTNQLKLENLGSSKT